jgi:pimeloyl-ACP methyl ester carboxylesterase
MSHPAGTEQQPVPSQRGRRWLRWLGGIVVGVLLLSVVGAIYESSAESADDQRYPPPGQMVDVGGYRLHINCAGSGSPTVVIEAGLGDWSTAWSAVQAEVAKTTRVCSYDRAGMGWSEPGPLPRNAAQFAKELKALLHNASVAGPYVLVGHSLGGLPVRVFAHDYPSDVAGVVLIDSMHPGQSTRSAADAKAPATTYEHALPILPALARLGLVRLLARPLGLVPPGAPHEAADYALVVRPKLVQAWLDENQQVADSLAQADAVTTFGDLPLIVLTAALDQQKGWQGWQDELARLSTHSQHLVAEQSDHNIELHQPDAAVAAIVRMVEQLRP